MRTITLRKVFTRRRAIVWVFAPVLLVSGCGDSSDSSDNQEHNEPARQVSLVDQGWDAATRRGFYHIAQGSELMPLSWFLALELPNAQGRLVDHLRDFGFLESDATASENPHRLPVGFTAARDDETSALYGDNTWVGLTCAACHTGELEIDGKRIRIDGGPSLIDFYAFQRSLLAAVEATVSDDAKFSRFQATVQGARPDSLRGAVSRFSRAFRARVDRTPEYQVSGVTVPGGPGRLDGLGAPVNETLCKLSELGDPALRALVEEPRNCAGGQPSTSFPQLWGVTQMEFVQWAGNVHGSLTRNVGEVNGVYGINWVDAAAPGVPRFRTTADVRASHTIEKWLSQLEAPSWRAMAAQGLVPPLRDDLVEKGSVLFGQKCQQCHAVQPEFTTPNANGYSYWKVNVTPQKDVGTDAKALEVANARRAFLPALFRQSFITAFGPSAIAADGSVPVGLYRVFVIRAQVRAAFAEREVDPDEATLLSDCRDDHRQTAVGYKGRSLEGVVFTAPYLHNGSVPTLDDLLKPASARPKTFVVGCSEYDTERLGYRCDATSERAFLLDTSLPSNSNAGHEYGSELGANDRTALLEFLKSLEQPKPAPLPQSGICV